MTRNQYIDRFGLKRNTWRSVAAMLSLMIIFMIIGHKYQEWKIEQFQKWEKTILSPISNAVIKVVHAEEDQTELEQITQYIVKKFQPLGENKAVWALGCFISESHLSPQAYHLNDNNTWDYGIAQWNQVHGQTIDQLKDWKHQIDLAYDLFVRKGKGQWYGSACK